MTAESDYPGDEATRSLVTASLALGAELENTARMLRLLTKSEIDLVMATRHWHAAHGSIGKSSAREGSGASGH